MFRNWMRYVLMDQAGDDGPVSGGAASEAPAVSAEPAAATEQPAATVLSSAASTEPKGIPEKYQVKNEDGSLNLEASSAKLAEAYANAEKRIGSGDLPPKTAEEYAIAVPDALKDAFDPKADPLMQDFVKGAHEAGLTQKQLDFVMGKYFDIAPGLVNGSVAVSAEECAAELKQEWTTDEQYKAEVGKAYQAAAAYGDVDTILAKYGNDPVIIKLLAKVGGELGEDAPPNPGNVSNGGQSVESMMAGEAYNNPRHADHARVSAAVKAHFDRQAAQAAKSGNVPLI